MTQYLLSEDEMAAIDRRADDARKMPSLEALTNVCQHVATTMIQTTDVNGGGKRDTPHGCIHVPDPRGPQWQTRYCDFCQIRGICPQVKEFSK